MRKTILSLERGLHEPYSNAMLRAVDSALRKAWDMAKRNPNHQEVLFKGGEEEITNILEEMLEAVRRSGVVDGYTPDFFDRTVRDKNFANYNKTKLKCQPDLVFIGSVSARETVITAVQDGIFVECKVIEQSLNNYFSEGIKRFIIGDYAWRMPHAYMLAYCRSDHKMPNVLVTNLRKNDNAKQYLITKWPEKCPFINKKPVVYFSAHNRDWLHATGERPGPIEIGHLWLRVYRS